MRTGGEVKIHNKVGNCFYSKVPKVVNLMNQHSEKHETIISSPFQRKFQEDEENLTLIISKLNQFNNKMKPKTTSKNKETKEREREKKRTLTRKANRLVCRKCTVYVHEDCIFGIYNTWCEVIHIKTDFIHTATLFLNIYA